ncbi:hypothetical protein GWI33_020621 [Rhynchophorus ferrugineus]|uniref:Uncharacterized protein n=1 Tax=Rhynchophorus ferrugineus TaxID=354439 RepID=A0A834HP64_RHYFE|nr:hypothetical protein GWI33_020621 [Rhynchophorus ferrugineus]
MANIRCSEQMQMGIPLFYRFNIHLPSKPKQYPEVQITKLTPTPPSHTTPHPPKKVNSCTRDKGSGSSRPKEKFSGHLAASLLLAAA